MARSNNPNVAKALDELFPAQDGSEADQDAVWIERDLIEPNPQQPRRRFDAGGLRELGNSLQTHGQLQACVVRPHPTAEGRFQLISGERRWRAAAPEYGARPRLRCIIRQADERELLQLALAENAHREDLSLIERARALRALKESEPGFTWDNVAARANISKRRILHLVELLELPPKMQKKIDDGTLNEKHGRALLALQNDTAAQTRLLEEIEANDLSGNQSLSRAESGRHIASSRGSSKAQLSTDGKLAADRSQPPLANASPDESTNGQKTDSLPDPLQQALKPAGALLAEAARQVKILSLSADRLSVNYRRDLKAELKRLRQQLDRIDREVG